MKIAVFWDIMPCGSCKNRRFRETYRLNHQSTRIDKLGMLAVTSNQSTLQRNFNVVPSSPIFVTPMVEVIRSSKKSVLTGATWHSIPEDGNLHIFVIHR
jgi:hypothetical protein